VEAKDTYLKDSKALKLTADNPKGNKVKVGDYVYVKPDGTVSTSRGNNQMAGIVLSIEDTKVFVSISHTDSICEVSLNL
jgi:hypothetical protein